MNYRELFPIKRLWLIFGATMILMFALLLIFGGVSFRVKPPVPDVVVVEGSNPPEVIFSKSDIDAGRDVWRRIGGMEMGSVWGHGAYLAPDWTTDVLHREAMHLANQAGPLDSLSEPDRAKRIAEVTQQIRTNTYDATTGTITVSRDREEAIHAVIDHYEMLFGISGDLEHGAELREQYAMPETLLNHITQEDVHAITAWWWWTSWAAGTNRPGYEFTYTSNWPHEPLIGNTPTAPAFIWTFVSVVLLICGIGLLCWFFLREREEWIHDTRPSEGFGVANPLSTKVRTASMLAVKKYLWIVAALILVQVILGAVTAHYQVEGQEFYGIPISDVAPYAMTRTWHVQLAVLWIATAWLGAGLYLGPMIAGKEPRGQAFGVNFLWVALVIAVVGSLAGAALVLTGQMTDPTLVYWFGHQGYEFLDMGRAWQILIAVGLIVWLVLMGRCVIPAIREKRPDRHLLLVLFLSSLGVGLLFCAGLLYDRTSHLTVVEYWRWWVVHLWVEGVFEVFATAWVAWIFVHMRLLRAETAAIYVMFSAMIFLGGGVLGTFHHLYFAGTPQSVLALGAVFSALEVVPLALIAFDAHDHWKVERYSPWVKRYSIPLKFFLAVAFWNLVGAGVLGFLINPPLSLYFMQGLMTTPTHGHAALFGVYGLLGIGLLLLCLRDMPQLEKLWSDKVLNWVFWLFNVGLALMVFVSLLPQGILQGITAFSEGYWHARTAEFMHSPIMETLVWLRVPGDIVFTIAAVLLVGFVFLIAFSKPKNNPESEAGTEEAISAEDTGD